MAYYAEKDFFQDEAAIAAGQALGEGKLRLDWYNTDNERVDCAPANAKRGLTYEDCNVGRYGYDAMPEVLRNRYSMAARGSVLVPGLPDLGYVVNRKSDVWSDNVSEMYEEAKARRWAPAVDIDWAALRALDLAPELQASVSQLCTALEEVALVLMEFSAHWVALINQEFLELKSYLCAVLIDEARHIEVFRKRALTAGGLKRASATIEQAMKELLSAETYTEGSLVLNVMINSLLLGVFRQAARISTADAQLFRLCMQDSARELQYGVGQIRYHLQHHKGREEFFQDFLDQSEHAFVGVAASPELLEPLIVLAGRGTSKAQIDSGREEVRLMLRRCVDEYLERLAGVGLDRRERSRLPGFFS